MEGRRYSGNNEKKLERPLFEALDQLKDLDYLRGGMRSKSVYLTEAGIKQAKQLMEKYNMGEMIDE